MKVKLTRCNITKDRKTDMYLLSIDDEPILRIKFDDIVDLATQLDKLVR